MIGMNSNVKKSYKQNTPESKWEKQGQSCYGYITWHVSTKFQHRLETKTLILHADFTPLMSCQSDAQIPNVSNLLLSINSTLNAGKFVHSLNAGEIRFSISANKTSRDEASIQRELQFFEAISQRAIEFHLPRILFAIGRISLNELQRISGENKKIRRLRPEHLTIMAFLSCKALEVAERAKVDKPASKTKETAEVSSKDESSKAWDDLKMDENLAQSSLIDLIKVNGLDPLLKRHVHFVKQHLLVSQDMKIEYTQSGEDKDKEFREFVDYFRNEEAIITLEKNSQFPQEDELEADKSISARFISQNENKEEYFLMKTPRLCTLYVTIGTFTFLRNRKTFTKKCNLLIGKFDEDDIKMAEPLARLLEYFYTSPDAYHTNILPHYRKLQQDGVTLTAIEDAGFYSEFNKHGTVENFLNFKRETAKFILLILRGIVSSQIYMSKKHKMIHTDISLYNIYITRGMQPRLGFLNKAYIIDPLTAKNIMKSKYQSIADYWKTLIKPSDYVCCPAEIFQNKGISEKSVVFRLGALIMQHIFETKPKIKKRNYEAQISEKQVAGTFSINFMPADESAKGSVETLEPLRVFAQACLEPDPVKRPTLVELGVFLFYCLKSLDYTYA